MMSEIPGTETELQIFSRRRALISAISLFPATRLVFSQSQDNKQPPVFSTDVKVVNVFATVRDKQGQIVRNLTKDDFLLEEDGRPQTIRYFSQQSDLPLTLGLLIDTSRSERRMLGTEREATYTFLEQVMRPDKDKAFLIHFDHDVELLQDLTSSRQRLEKALDLLDKPEWSNSGDTQPRDENGSGGYGRRGGGWRHGGGGTAFFDAVYLASDDLMKKQAGRNALIMLTDGEDTSSKVSLAEAVSSAQRATRLPIRCESPMKKVMAGLEDQAWAGTVVGAAEEAAAAVPMAVARVESGQTARRYFSRFRKRRAVATSKSRKKDRWIKSTSRSKKNCAANILSAIPRTGRIQMRGSEKFSFRPNRRD